MDPEEIEKLPPYPSFNWLGKAQMFVTEAYITRGVHGFNLIIKCQSGNQSISVYVTNKTTVQSSPNSFRTEEEARTFADSEKITLLN